MIFRVNKDGIVWARSHAGFTADANRFVEINDTVGAFEHRGRGAGGDTWRVCALIAAGDLMRATRLRKNTNVDVFHIRARY
jgi:hypothetical protein